MLRSLLTLLLVLSCLLSTVQAVGQSQLSILEQELGEAQAKGTSFQNVELFSTNQTTDYRLKMDKVLSDATFLDLNQKELQKLFDANHEAIRFVIPMNNGREIVINALRHEILSNTFKVSTQDGEYLQYAGGRFYKGVVENAEHSLASISVFKDEVIAIFSTDKTGNMVLGQMQSDQRTKTPPYVIFDDQDFLVNSGFECETEHPEMSELINVNRPIAGDVDGDPANCLSWYFECEYNMFLENGGVSETVNKMLAIYNEVQIIYNNEAIINVVDQIFVWSEPDGYPTGSTGAARNEFVSRRTPIPGNANVAHLISRGAPSNGGIANGIGGFCYDRPYTAGATPHSYSWIQSNFNPFPTYSWTVNVIAHENGHNLGSFHTHGCYWNGVYPNGGSQIDDCGNEAGATEGAACWDTNNPILPNNGGTVMSYCHLVGGVGINLINGFGPQPGDVIRDLVHNGSCTSSCGVTTCPSVNADVTNIDCTGNTNGAIDLIVIGGTPAYAFNWSNDATTEDLDNLSAGDYTVTVTDSSGECEVIRTYTIIEPSEISTFGNVSPEVGGGDGAIDLVVSGGTPAYTYAWSNGATTEDVSGLSSGSYSVTVTDSRGCQETDSFFVPSQVGCQAVINEFPFNEGFETGSLGVFGQGLGDDFNWEANSGPTPTGRTGPASAYEGSFYAYADATGNTRGKTAILVGCFDFTGLAGPNVSFAYNMYGSNIGSLSIVVEDVNSGESAVVWTQTSNQGAFWQTATANLTGFGGRNVEVSFISTTGAGGSDRADIAIDDVIVDVGPACDPPVLSVSSTDASCSNTSDGTASVSATGGTPPYTYQWSSGQTTATATGLSPGTYGVTVTDAADCTASGATSVGAPASLGLSFAVIGESSPGAADGEIDLTVTGGTPGYSYNWSTGATTQDLVGLSEGVYSVTVTDSNGCTTSGSAEVFVGGGGTCNDEGIGLPVSQGFEFEFGDFENSGDFSWSRSSGSTPTRRTGPSGAFAGSFYGLAEANGNLGDQAVLLSPCLDLTGLQATAEFAYHMYGVTMGSLSFEIAENGGPNWITLWSASGDQGNQWNTQSVDLSAYEGLIVRVRWVATIGGGGAARSDIALDAISLTSGGSSTTGGGSSGNSGESGSGGTFGGGIFTGGSYGGLFGFEKATNNPNVTVTALVPVPARNNLTVNLEAGLERTGTVRILDYTGRMIEERQEIFQKGTNSFQIDVTNYNSGLYFLSIDTGDSRTVKKFEVID